LLGRYNDEAEKVGTMNWLYGYDPSKDAGGERPRVDFRMGFDVAVHDAHNKCADNATSESMNKVIRLLGRYNDEAEKVGTMNWLYGYDPSKDAGGTTFGRDLALILGWGSMPLYTMLITSVPTMRPPNR
jgi:hypothetical protein